MKKWKLGGVYKLKCHDTLKNIWKNLMSLQPLEYDDAFFFSVSQLFSVMTESR